MSGNEKPEKWKSRNEVLLRRGSPTLKSVLLVTDFN
jgi:hypothetical protein